ncbi:MAG: flagellar hook-basal body complex protein [Butyrivibrio sp.]|uniref:flagellar hook protein FlgE n=1 Tax=Butyrivibrio sp. TaxID=28121 RepID=UPI001B076072|nr:flagellar hook-basal body complex protein [Butyrivibrio sp.]MBO6242488.1 flagellar hook-basal body complex protein [Butyrivibrio sp.]
MMRSLYSGVAGLRTHQTKMDVLGNNIANVNTTSFKSQSITFSDLMYQTTQAASGATETKGGVNARQIGLGAKSGAIATAIESQGATQTTNNPFDIMITGKAFFVVNNGQENLYTRDGSFYVDGAGNLAMQSNGYYVMGWQATVDEETGERKIDMNSGLQNLPIMTADNMTYAPASTTAALFSGNIDDNDTNINSDNGKTITLEFYDNKGYLYTAKFTLMNDDTDPDLFTLTLSDILDSSGKSIGTTLLEGVNFETSDGTETKTITLDFDAATGAISSAGGYTSSFIVNLMFDQSVEGLEPFGYQKATTDQTTNQAGQLAVDFSTVTNYNTNGSATIKATKGDKKSNNTGRMVGEMNGINISTDGQINATYSNGQTKLLGQIASAEFANASGLAKEGDNLYSSTLNSGDATIQDITTDGGYMNTGVLEMSNVDLSKEFTEMITTQRGFQANSRIITVSDTLLEELTNLKR